MHCPSHPHVRLELVNAATGERTCPACAGQGEQSSEPVRSWDGRIRPGFEVRDGQVVPIRQATCAHAGDRHLYRPSHAMEICADCGCTVRARKG